ncbi:hypothetical protein FACS189464_0840 [Bacteroidia bacterium]|nr:hypothetical protein FACS189464_0840 [Bacteroidia bacterium]
MHNFKICGLALFKRYIYIIVSVLCCNATIVAQSKIGGSDGSGIVNIYTKVTSLTNVNNQAILTVSEASGFKGHDTVLLIQMTGVSIDRAIVDNAGKYEFHLIASVNSVTNTITLRMPASFSPTDELVQLVRVPAYKNVEVTGGLTCEAWDYDEKGTGGVVAIMAEQTLTVAADIDVTGKGFRGGKVTPPLPLDILTCPTPPLPTDDGYPASAYLIAGNKGEGFLKKSIYENVPRGKLASNEGSGGGGGNGVFAGGGGGGNGGDGGEGGYSACDHSSSHPNLLALGGGRVLSENSAWADYIFMGGGGGTGTGNGTAGGNGGGIVMLIAKTIAFKNNAKIYANGESVYPATASGGAGGGGAGGSVLLVADNFDGAPSIEIQGGKGGDAIHSATSVLPLVFDYPNLLGSYGTGGGGGGGLLVVRQDSLPRNIIIANSGGGVGNTQPIIRNTLASTGTVGDTVTKHQLQQKGFLYNFIISNDTVFCDGDSKTLSASLPQGGEGNNYAYQWLSKTGEHGNWENAAGVANAQHYTTAPVSDTVFYKRVVTTTQRLSDNSIIPVVDTSSYIKLIAIPAIKDNALSTQADTALCENASNWLIRGLQASAAAGTISYQWQRSNAESQWTDIDDTPNCETAATPAGVTLYRRIVNNWYAPAGVTCRHTSNTVKVTIIPRIENNVLVADQTLCDTEHPVSLKQGEITGGDGVYKYQWQSSETETDWNDLPDTTDDLQPEEGYTGTRYYIRTVSSGPCTSRSPATLVRFDRTPSDAVFTVPAPDTLHFKFNTIVETAPISDGVGRWEIDGTGSLSDTNAPNSKAVTGLELGSAATVKWTVTSGVCPEKSAQVSVIVKDVTIPSGFSPNNDQINDCFGVLGSENAEHFDLFVINRNNKVVFQTSSLVSVNPYPCLWEGKDASGNELPAGSYFYRLTLKGSNQKQYLKTGYVTLKK